MLTSAICLDLAHPSIFQSLSGLADLILAPGKTWDVQVGEAMHAQAAVRADEMGSLGLWCDAGGLSGVVGRGESGVQRGRGSFVHTVGIPYLASEEGSGGRTMPMRTFYARTGDMFAAVMVWVPFLLAFWFTRRTSSAESAAAAEGEEARGPIGNLRNAIVNHTRTAFSNAIGYVKRPAPPTDRLIDV